MHFVRTCSLILMALMPLLGHAALADGTGRAASTKPARHVQTSPKDCTRFNGRIGYYANPWCSPAEQRAWDLWDAAHRTSSPGK